MNKKQRRNTLLGDILGCLGALVIFGIPFYFMFITALKDKKNANLMKLTFPKELHWENFVTVFEKSKLLLAYKNSLLLTFGAVALLIVLGSMAGYILQRKRSKTTSLVNILVLSGLMVPPAILPTIWFMQGLGIYKTMFGMILIETALRLPFTITLYRGFMGSIPKELEEAACIDGCSAFGIFTRVIFPLLKPVTATVIIVSAVNIFNDFTNPMYFLPGADNVTVQLTLYNFLGAYESSYNLLFADVLLITLPMLILFLFFNKKIVEGMVAGSVKG